jgi:hypothetical protein
LSDAEWERQVEQGRQRDSAAAAAAGERMTKAVEERRRAEDSGNEEWIQRAREEERNAERNQQRVLKQNAVNNRQRSAERRRRGLRDSYEPQGQVLSEDHKKILREIKQPVVVKEQPRTQKLEKYRPNFAGKYTSQNTPDVTACPQSDEMVKAKNAAGQTWRTKDKHWSNYESTERMNVVYDNVGHGSQYWDMIVNENQNKKGIRDRAVQEHLNMIAHNRAMLSEDPTYQSPFRNNIEEQETIQADQDPLFKKVAKRLKPAIDYPNKPSPNGFPTEPPPEMIDGWHPEYGNKSNYYNTLDPHSANSMPATGNAEIDAKVRRAKTLKRVLGKRA